MNGSRSDVGRGTSAALTAAAALACAASVSAAGFGTQAFPVPVQVERERVRSALLLQLDVERYDLPYDVFAARAHDAAERAFVDFMSALRRGDAAALATLRPGDAPDSASRIVKDFAPGFALPVMPRVVARVGVGEAQEFVWEWPRAGDPARLAFTVTEREGAPRVEVVTSARPLETLILDVFQQEALHPGAYAAVGSRRRYAHTFPLGASGTRGAHPVALVFDGQPLDVEILGKRRTLEAPRNAVAAAEAPGVLESAYRALERRALDQYWGAYTDKSRDKLRAWIERMPAAELDAFAATAVRPRRVLFVLDADPALIVFFSFEGETALRYEYLLKTPAGPKLTNAYFEGYLDDVLRNAALFPSDFESFRKGLRAAADPR